MNFSLLSFFGVKLTGDRLLHDHEKRILITERSQELDALATLREAFFQGGEPTLFEMAFVELFGTVEVQRNIIIDQGRKIRLLEIRLEELAPAL